LSTSDINRTKIKPSRWFYVIGIIVSIAGPAISSMFLFSTVFSTISSLTEEVSSIQVVVPGRNEIRLLETGKYTIFYEHQSVVGNSVYSTSEDIPGIQVTLISKDLGSEIPLSRSSTSFSYTIGGRSGVSLFDFTIDSPGTYEIAASYPSSSIQGPHIVLAILHSSSLDKMFGDITGIALSGFAMVFVPFAAGAAIMVITYLKRRNARRKILRM
jgi:hypothetical protein